MYELRASHGLPNTEDAVTQANIYPDTQQQDQTVYLVGAHSPAYTSRTALLTKSSAVRSTNLSVTKRA